MKILLNGELMKILCSLTILSIVGLISFFLYFYNLTMNAKLHYYMAASPVCILPKEYQNNFYKQPISEQVAIVKGCAISNTGARFVQALIEGEPKLF